MKGVGGRRLWKHSGRYSCCTWVQYIYLYIGGVTLRGQALGTRLVWSM
jgi:hypothetical protein